MKPNQVILLILMSTFFIHGQPKFVKSRNYINLTDWTFSKGNSYNAQSKDFESTDWKNITVPHTYSMDAINENGYYRGVAWYRSEVIVPESMTDKKIFIRFEAVGHSSEVYINGKRLGNHSGGYSAFCYSIEDFVDIGKTNIIAVKVTNEPDYKTIPITDKLFNIYGGIYRPVQIFATPKNRINPEFYASPGVFIESTVVNEEQTDLEVRIHVNVMNASQLKCIIKDANGEVQAEKLLDIEPSEDSQIIKVPFQIKNAIFWHGKKNPYLYTADIQVIHGNEIDLVSQRFGIKTTRVDPEKGFFLNNEPYNLHGVAMHQEWKQYGPALNEEAHLKDMSLIEEIGATTVRLSHYQHSETTYNLADEKGILAWSEIPFVHDYSGRESGNAKQQLKELIYQNYNHPCIYVWGLWNEVRAYESPDEPCVQLTKELNELAHKLDNSRPTVSASDRGIKSNMNGITDLQAWNKYFGWYYGVYKDLGKWLDESHKAYPDIPLGISEYGAGGNIYQQDLSKLDKPFGLHFPEQDQTYCHEVSWKVIKDRPFVWSSYVWNLFDFSVGDWNRGGIPFTNHKGLVTFDRSTKKDAFYFYKANWSEEPVLYIAERRNNNRNAGVVNVKIYTNQKNVTLYVNDKKVGKKKLESDINIISFENVTLKKGKNTIKVSSNKSLHDQIEWTLN